MVPSAPTTTGTSSAFNFPSFPNSIGKSWYLSISSCSFTMMFWSHGMAMSMIKQLFAILSMHTILDHLCSITLSSWIEKSHKILHHSFSSTELGTCSYHLSLHSRWNFLHISQLIFFATLSQLFQYWFFARLGKALMMCVTLSVLEFHWSCQCYTLISQFFQLVLVQHKRDFQSPFSGLYSSTTTTLYFHYDILSPLQIVHVAIFPSTLSMDFLSFLPCSQ